MLAKVLMFVVFAMERGVNYFSKQVVCCNCVKDICLGSPFENRISNRRHGGCSLPSVFLLDLIALIKSLR